jgi:hypothetical protein
MGFPRGQTIVLLLALLTAIASARGAIIDGSGNVHVTAAAAGFITQRPPDTTFAPPATSASNSAQANAIIVASSISAFVSAAAGGIEISGSGSASHTQGATSSAAASGTVTFTVTDTEPFAATLSDSGTSTSFVNFTLRDGWNSNVLFGSGDVTLTPGKYSVQWSFAPADFYTFNTIFVDYQFGLAPEPAAPSLLAAAGLLPLACRRRRQRR